MVFAMFGKKTKTRPLPDGRKELRRCPLCGETSVFVECEVDKTYTAYSVVSLWSSSSTAFSCAHCLECMPYEDTEPPELSPREQAKVDAAARKADAEAAKLAAKAKADAAAKIKADAAAYKADAKAREDDLDDELAAMKGRLGLD